MNGYPYDPDRLARTAQLLYDALPAHLKANDAKAAGAVPSGPQDLRTLVDILAAPLAALRQSLEEMHGDLFVDTAGDSILPLLADSIGLQLVFGSAEANRRDLAGSVGLRRRKGTPAMLEELARTLSDRLVSSNEGWKLVQISQDLNILRLTRTTPDLRPPSVAERISGPLENLAKTVDPRLISARSGRVHARQMAHWLHLSQFFPLRGASPHQMPDGTADLRFSFDAENAWRALRCRATGAEDDLRTDRVPELIFAQDPGEWFDREGRFSVRIANLPAATAPKPVIRAARGLPASDGMLTTSPTLEVIDYNGARTSGPVEIALMAVPVVGAMPDPTSAVLRGAIEMDITGQINSLPAAAATPADAIPMLRLSTTGGAASRFFAGAVLRLSGGLMRARHPSPVPDLAQEGYLNGSLYVTIPPMRMTDTCWFYIGADGALHNAAASGGTGIDLPLNGNALPERSVSTSPVGPVWPQAQATADRTPFATPLMAPAAAPVHLHGGQALHPSGNSLLPVGDTNALVFALSYAALGRQFHPMVRLVWTGGDPSSATWEPLEDSADVAADLHSRLATLASVVETAPADLALAIRFESQRPNARLSPAELSFTGHDGRAVLIHTPEFRADDTDMAWPRGPGPISAHSVAVQVGRDGSTWTAGTNLLRRKSLGQATPLSDPMAMQRRVVRWRKLCPWQNETLVDVLDPTPPSQLHLDPEFGLFALAASEPPQSYPPGPTPLPASISVDMQTGATMPIGALPIDHDRALGRAPEAPTRLVSASGHLGPTSDPSGTGQTLHPTLADALAAIAVDPNPREVIELSDSRFYPAETLTWPDGPESLVVRAARDTQPVVEIAGSAPGAAAYQHLDLTGLALTSTAALTLDLPAAQTCELNHVTIRRSDLTLAMRFNEDTGVEALTVVRSILGPLTLLDPGQVRLIDSILDAGADGGADALLASNADLTMDRCTVLGSVRAQQVDISDSILRHPVFVGERFEGCIRYSFLAPGGQTPRKHRVMRRPFPRFVTFDRRDPAYLRLTRDTEAAILTGASDGGEVGAFNFARIAEIERAVLQRLSEHTPAGLRTGMIRKN
ncbi:hypothetical protein NBRC116594_09400 [Shimia sp. NS0008-38b]|uniref:hypothetical protein n=1 Tax=Shimia sp. NS0008-38b TaxID=3127653 RepID=UPI00310565E0